MEPFKRQLWASALSVDGQNANDEQDEENSEGFQPAPKTESSASFNPKPDEKKEEDAKPDSSDFKEDDFG